MKKYGNLFEQLVSYDNLLLAHKKASKGKSHYHEVKWVNNNLEYCLLKIQDLLITKTFKTSEYTKAVAIKGGKLRTIHKLPYFPDRIVQHALANVCKEFWVKSMIRDTFQSIEGRGTTDCFKRVRDFVKNNKPIYAIKLDIVKFYPNVCTTKLIEEDPFKIKCKDTLWLLHEILLSLPFLPLGNHISQYSGNLKLTKMDWYIKQELKVKGYFRYCDDLILFGNDKKLLKTQVFIITRILKELGLQIKPLEIYNLTKTPLDFVGMRVSHDKVLLRKKIKDNFVLSAKLGKTEALPSYKGWCKHANAKNLYYKYEKITNENAIRYKAA